LEARSGAPIPANPTLDMSGAPWWRVYEREPELIRAWCGGVDQYYD
jgi:hypothetical protein